MLAYALFLAVISGLATAHSYVSGIETSDGQNITTYQPFQDPYHSPLPKRITRPFANNSPVQDVTKDDIICNFMSDGKASASSPAPIHATVAAGTSLDFYWASFPDSHKGPVLTYMALCDGDCESYSVKGGSQIWFKIDEGGYDGTTWATEKLAQAGAWKGVKIPKSLKPGNYLVRHEAIALHSAGSKGGAQFYMQCHQFTVTGSGSDSASGDSLVSFPGAYKASDPGILINIYYPKVDTYTIPGPSVWPNGGSSSGSHAQASTGSGSGSSTTSPSTDTESAYGLASSTSSSDQAGGDGKTNAIDIDFSSAEPLSYTSTVGLACLCMLGMLLQ